LQKRHFSLAKPLFPWGAMIRSRQNRQTVWETKMRRVWLLALAFCSAFSAANAAGTGAPIGRWITANHDAVIQIAPCGADLCGQIVGIQLAHPHDPMPNDWQGHPQCGLTILQTAPRVDATGATVWVGEVIDPRDGSIYQAQIQLDPARHLVLHGYIGLAIFGRTQTWTPYAGRTLAGCHLAADSAD
jgi:uncharacterized protein (DUF2147 family)